MSREGLVPHGIDKAVNGLYGLIYGRRRARIGGAAGSLDSNGIGVRLGLRLLDSVESGHSGDFGN